MMDNSLDDGFMNGGLELDYLLEYLEDLTVHTKALRLNHEQLKALAELHCYHHGNISWLTPSHLHLLSDLEIQVNSLINNVGGVVFIKSGRKSPIDNVLRPKNRVTERVFLSFCKDAHADLQSSFQQHNSVLCHATYSTWIQAVNKCLLVTNGYDALQLVAKSVQACCALASEGPSYLFIRQFIEIDPALQFRVFISKKHITAITQKHGLYSKWLTRHEKRVLHSIHNFVTLKVLNRITHFESFCLDIIILPERKLEFQKATYRYIPYERIYKDFPEPVFEIKVIQLQPLYNRSATGFFDWDKDKNIMLNGPLEFRIRKDPNALLIQEQTSKYSGLFRPPSQSLLPSPTRPIPIRSFGKYWGDVVLDFLRAQQKTRLIKRSIVVSLGIASIALLYASRNSSLPQWLQSTTHYLWELPKRFI